MSAETTTEADLARRLAALTLEDKVRVLTGADFWSLHPLPAAGLRRLVVSDGPAGVRGELWDERDPSANVPSPTSLGATWDPDLVRDLGLLLAGEARRKGVDVLLAPTVNLHRTPYGGRHFENISEDPLLVAALGTAYVRGVQDGGVAATAKHFVANDTETDRMSVDAVVDERTLRELYLAPFEEIVRAGGVWAVMAAYNLVNGTTATETPLLRDVLQDEWGFDGVTMSDWFATRSTEPAARGGLDLAMPGPVGPWGEALVTAVRDGLVDEARIDDHVLRILRLAARVGALEGIAPVATAPELTDDEVRARLRTAAAAGTVLVRNDGVLPLSAAALSTVALVGPNAEVGRTLGGGSATVYPAVTVSPAQGLVAALPGVEVVVEEGVRSSTRTAPARDAFTRRADGTPGLDVRFVGPDGSTVGTERRSGGTLNWMTGFGADVPGPVAQVEVRTTLVADRPGTWAVGGSGLGRFRLELDGVEVLDTVLQLPPGADLVEGLSAPPQGVHEVQLAAGDEVAVLLVHDVGSGGTSELGDIGPMLHVSVEPPHRTDDEGIAAAAALAARSDVAVVVVGTTEEVESEGYDRSDLRLPGRQDELVRAVAAANPRTVVVVNSGAPVLLPWLQDVAATLLVWFPGQEFGAALADVLLGVVEPGGRTPTTWPATEAALPSATPVDGLLAYTEGLRIGYRDPARDVAVPFGHGLGYTTWEMSDLEVVRAPDGATDGEVAVTVRNTGARAGREVVQVYLSRPGSTVDRPERWLAGFAGVRAAAGESVRVRVRVPARTVQHWDVAAHAWATEAGAFVVRAGRSVADLPLRAELLVVPGVVAGAVAGSAAGEGVR